MFLNYDFNKKISFATRYQFVGQKQCTYYKGTLAVEFQA